MGMSAFGRFMPVATVSLGRPLPVITRGVLIKFVPKDCQVVCKQLGSSGQLATSLSQRRDELGFRHHSSRTTAMPDNSDCKIATADALTLLLHNQHALSAAIEEITKWLSENGVGSVAANAMSAMETLDTNAQAITDSILRIRQS